MLIIKLIPKVKRESYYYLFCLTEAVMCETCKELIRDKWGSDTTFLFFLLYFPFLFNELYLDGARSS